MKLFSSTGGKIPNNAKERKESKEEKENTTKSSIKVNIAKATSSSNNSVSSSSSSSFTVESTIKNNNVLELMKSDSDGDDEDDKDFLPEYNNEREESKSSASTSESDTSEGTHKSQKIRPSMAVYNIDLLGKRVRITFSDRVATGLYKEGAKGKKYQVQGDHVLAYRLFEKGLEKSFRHVLPAAAYQQLTRFVVRENVMTEAQLNTVLEKNKEILKNLISKESREKILKALEKLPEEKKVTAGALDAYNSIYYSVACSHLAEEYLRFRNKKSYSAFLPIPKYSYISKGAEAQHVHEGIQGLSHQYHILSEWLEGVSFGKQEGDGVRVILIERTDEEEQLAVEKNIAKNIFKLFFYPKVDGMDLSEEKEDKESESGNRTNNLHILAKVIENSLITVFNIYPIFWYLREKITDAFVRQVALEGVVDPFSFLKSAKNHCLRGLAPF